MIEIVNKGNIISSNVGFKSSLSHKYIFSIYATIIMQKLINTLNHNTLKVCL